MVAFAAYSISQ